MSPAPSLRSAWVQLYEARRLNEQIHTRSPGRPSASIPRYKVGMTLSQGEIAELETWKELFSSLVDRNISAGETVGIVLRICTARLHHLTDNPAEFETLNDLVDQLIRGTRVFSSKNRPYVRKKKLSQTRRAIRMASTVQSATRRKRTRKEGL